MMRSEFEHELYRLSSITSIIDFANMYQPYFVVGANSADAVLHSRVGGCKGSTYLIGGSSPPPNILFNHRMYSLKEEISTVNLYGI